MKVPWHQFLDAALGMAVENGLERIGDVGAGINVVELQLPTPLGRGFYGFRSGCRGLSGRGLRP